jgi:hypothetical protein
MAQPTIPSVFATMNIGTLFANEVSPEETSLGVSVKEVGKETGKEAGISPSSMEVDAAADPVSRVPAHAPVEAGVSLQNHGFRPQRSVISTRERGGERAGASPVTTQARSGTAVQMNRPEPSLKTDPLSQDQAQTPPQSSVVAREDREAVRIDHPEPSLKTDPLSQNQAPISPQSSVVTREGRKEETVRLLFFDSDSEGAVSPHNSDRSPVDPQRVTEAIRVFDGSRPEAQAKEGSRQKSSPVSIHLQETLPRDISQNQRESVLLGRRMMPSMASSASSPEPTIRVTIGRVEVRAMMQAPPAPKKQATQSPLSLGDYLKQRSEGKR